MPAVNNLNKRFYDMDNDYVSDYRNYIHDRVVEWLASIDYEPPLDWKEILRTFDQGKVMTLFVHLHCGERDKRLPEATREVFEGIMELR